MEDTASRRFAKHADLFGIENTDKERLYEELGIIGEISYEDDHDDENICAEENILRTPKIKRPNHDLISRCRTPRKPRRPWRTNTEHSTQSSDDTGIFKRGFRRSWHCSLPNTISILTLPYEVVLHIFQFLDLTSLAKCKQVCKCWNGVASDTGLWKALNLKSRNLSILTLQNFLHNQAVAVCLNSAALLNDHRNNTWPFNSYYHGNNSTPVYSSMTRDSSSPMRDPFSRVYYYQVRHLDFTNADVSPTTLCLVLTRCNCILNLSLENLIVNHHVLGCLSNCRTLLRLNLTLCKDMTVSGLVEVLLACEKLLELNLAWSSVCNYQPHDILSSLPTTLTHLNIAGFRETLMDGHIAVIVSRCKGLQDLDVSDSNHLTAHAVDMVAQGLTNSLSGINLSRCYSVTPDSYLRFANMPFLHFLDVFGVMDDTSVAALAEALPRVNVSLRPFSAIARPTPNFCIDKPTETSTIWGHYVKF